MILQDNNGFTVNMKSIVAIEEGVGDSTRLYPIGSRKYLQFDLPFKKVEEAFKAAHSTNDFFASERKTICSNIPEFSVNGKRISLSIRKTEYNDGVSQSIVMDTDFLIDQELYDHIKSLEIGIDKGDYRRIITPNYNQRFDVAKLFDAEKVAEDLKQHIINFLSA